MVLLNLRLAEMLGGGFLLSSELDVILYGIKCNRGISVMKELVKAYTSEEIAEYLRLHPYTVRRLARTKKIPAFRVGGQWRFRKDAIDAWSKNKKQA